MKRKNCRLPQWAIKWIGHGKEDQKLCVVLVVALISYLVGSIAFLLWSSIGFVLNALFVIGAFVLLASMCVWLISQVVMLDSLRKEAIVMHEYAKTDEETIKASDRLKRLYVPIPEAA
jgi:hypothetical protein